MKLRDFKLFIILLLIIAEGCTIVYGIFEGWYSLIIFWNILLFISLYLLKSRLKDENLSYLFIFFYSFYSLYAYITNYLYVDNPNTEFFMMVDSKKFWNYSDQLMYSFDDVIKNQKLEFTETIRYTFFNFGNLVLSFFAQLIDQNNILIQKMQSVWLGAFSIPFIYLAFKKYFEKAKAFKYATIYGIFTHVCIYSVVFNRDPHVYFLYALGFYYVINYETRKNVFLKLCIIFIFVCGYRLEHGLFFLLYIIVFLYLKAKSNSNLKVLVMVLVPISGLIIAPFMLGKFQENSESYQNQIDRVERSESSTAAMLSKLPPGIKQLTMGINSQIAPAVPFWRTWFIKGNEAQYFKHSVAGYFTPWRFMESVANITWIYVWALIAVGLLNKKYKILPRELNYLFIVAVLLIMAASTSVNARRTYCVYPVVFLYALWMYNVLPKTKRRFAINCATIFVVVLTSLFLYLK